MCIRDRDDLSKFQDYKPDFKDADEVLEFLIENIEEEMCIRDRRMRDEIVGCIGKIKLG